MTNRFQARVVVVTGAASGLRQASACGFAVEGAQLILVDVNAKGLEETAAKIKAVSTLVEELGLDSFGSVEVAFELEEKFSLKIPDEALYKAKTVKDIVDYVAEQTSSKK